MYCKENPDNLYVFLNIINIPGCYLPIFYILLNLYLKSNILNMLYAYLFSHIFWFGTFYMKDLKKKYN